MTALRHALKIAAFEEISEAHRANLSSAHKIEIPQKKQNLFSGILFPGAKHF